MFGYIHTLHVLLFSPGIFPADIFEKELPINNESQHLAFSVLINHHGKCRKMLEHIY